MKICEYIPSASFFVGGGEIYPLMQARSLAKLGHKVEVVVLKVDKPSQYFSKYREGANDINIEYLESSLQDKEKYDKNVFDHKAAHQLYYSLSRAFINLCFRKNYDLVINHYGPAVLCVPKSVKQLLILHGVPSEWQEINNVAIRLADFLISDSQSISEGWKELFNFKEKIPVIGNAIDPEIYFPVKSKRYIDVLYLGRLIEIKGVQDLVRAVGKLKRRGISLCVKIAGDGPFRDELENLVKDLDIQSEIEFLGYIEEEKKNRLYNRAKVTVFPSYAKEGVLTTMLEAAATSSAIITTNCCGMVDFLKQSKNGLLFEPRDIEGLANSIEKLLTDVKLREHLGLVARKNILRNWTWDVNAEKIEKVILNSCTKTKNY